MVVSKAKDSKRKRRKENPSIAPQQSSVVESSPEVPKRTKVQAQRKFAQGHSAPTSSFNPVVTASSSSNTGPSTSSESREPPTEILPNKRPKTEDFLTFLCFRGTRELPAHLDFLNQGKPKGNTPVRSTVKKGKKGRPPKAVKNTEKTTSATVKKANKTEAAVKLDKNEKSPTRASKELRRNANDRQVQNVPDDDMDLKRRSNRTNTKNAKSPVLLSPDDKDIPLSKEGKVEKEICNKANKKSLNTHGRSSETPSKDSEKTRKAQAPCESKTTKFVLENESDSGNAKNSPKLSLKQQSNIKEKPPIKRPRLKESPIFIPSPESSGRMTRQRAFFEPVKVVHSYEVTEEEPKVETLPSIEDKKGLKENVIKTDLDDVEVQEQEKEKEQERKVAGIGGMVLKDSKIANYSMSPKDAKNKNLNVFDFSSDDEQPLAKCIKQKRGKSCLKKPKRLAKKPIKELVPKISVKKKNEEKNNTTEIIEKASGSIKFTDKAQEIGGLVSKPSVEADKLSKENNIKRKSNNLEVGEVSASPPPKKEIAARQSRKISNIQKASQGSQSTSPSQPNQATQLNQPKLNQRPVRKTKEAATIYMGIISHKLQLPDDEDDDNSLNSFPDLPNVKEMEKREIELKKNASQVGTSKQTQSPLNVNKPTAKLAVSASPSREDKPTTARRGRPPKNKKQLPIKREIEGMLVKKGALTKIVPESTRIKDRFESSKADSEDEDFLLNKEVDETKRKLEKNFSDSDDEPLAIKANVKSSDMDSDLQNLKTSTFVTQNCLSTSVMLPILPLTTKSVSTSPVTAAPLISASPTTAPAQTGSAASNPQSLSVFKSVEKKSPIPTSKILNVPATYAIPNANISTPNIMNMGFNKSTYLSQSAAHYHAVPHIRPSSINQFPTKTPTCTSVPVSTTPSAHLNSPLPQQSPVKYQTPPTTYPPPIEAYPSPKINPNFLTPKFDRTSIPRGNNFPSPSPVRLDASSSSSKTCIVGSNMLSPKFPPIVPVNTATGTPTLLANNAAVIAPGAAGTTVDTLKGEISSILAANLMPSKEESGKIFGIASVSLAQSSGPDNTKCTLGKCGSVHKPVLGPVVPTEGYIGDQLSSKERRKAKVNMSHEQIQKWLIECSPNPDEIQDDLEDDFDDNVRPNLFATTPPPTRDDKESTSFSSSSKATRDLGKSECAWSAKGPSLKAIPVLANTNKKEEVKQMETTNQVESLSDKDKTSAQGTHFTQRANIKLNSNLAEGKTLIKDKEEQSNDKASKECKNDAKKSILNKDMQASKTSIDKESKRKSFLIGKQTVEHGTNGGESLTNAKQKLITSSAVAAVANMETIIQTSTQKTPKTNSTNSVSEKIARRMPVYNQKTQKQLELNEAATTNQKKAGPFSYSAFSVDNEKSIYSFDKDESEEVNSPKCTSKPTFRRQHRNDNHVEESSNEPSASRISPTKKKLTTCTAEKVNKDIVNTSQNNSVSLTLSPSENCKQFKVSLETEKANKSKAAGGKASKAAKKSKVNTPTDADSETDGHTFYIPLQSSGIGDGDGGIQGVAVKLGREGPDGPNQKVIMHATLVTKAQMGTNSKTLPDSTNETDASKAQIASLAADSLNLIAELEKKINNATTSDATPGTSTGVSTITKPSSPTNSNANLLNKSVPIGTVQPRFKASESASTGTPQATTSTATGSGLVRVNSNSSLFSGSAKSKIGVPTHTANKKIKDDAPIKMSNNTAFPRYDDPTQMVEAPIFRPTEKEFADPIEFIERIKPIAARFGICKIIPPATFKPECRISDEMRFTAYNQYIHKMLYRWGPSVKELSAIKKYLATQSITMNHPPWIGGMEVDLPRLYHTVQELGGLKEVIEKKKWSRVAEEMCIPKLAQDRVTKLDDIYCKYLLPYDTLSPAERQKLFDEVEADWAKREARARRNAVQFINTESVSNEEGEMSSEDDEESEEETDGVSMECIVKGRSMPLSQFYRIARNTMALWFKNTEPTVNEVEADFWRHVAVRDSHVCVHSGSIDSSGWGYGFPSPGPKSKGSNYSRHPWNLKVLTNNPSSVLRSLGPVMGVTVPTLHVGMLFSACCWYRDPHGLSWIEYLHTGATKLWYGIPDDQSGNFRAALTSLIPTHCQNKTIWLPCDTVMVPPHMLTDRGVSLCRIEQKPGEFIVVFPRAFTSSLSTGYVVSESVYFATSSWLDLAKDDFRDIHESCEPAMFSLEQLLFALGYDQRVTSETLRQILPMLQEVFEKESAAIEQLKAAGVTSSEKVPSEKGSKPKKQQVPLKSIESECDLCRANLYISMVKTEEGNIYCLQHALKNLNNGNIQAKKCKLLYAYNVEDIENLIKTLKEKIQQKGGGGAAAIAHKKTK